MFAVDAAVLGAVITSALTGMAALLTAAGGLLIATKEGRRRERQEEARRRQRQEEALDAYREDRLSNRAYQYELRSIIVGAGLTCPPPPPSKVKEYEEKVAANGIG